MRQASDRAEKLKVFISYSRKDLAAAERLRAQLIAKDFEAYLDKHDILPGEPWQERLGLLIEGADTVVFLVSPDSVASPIVDWEVNEAERQGKRVLPVVIRDADPEKVPGRIKRLNYIFMRDDIEVIAGVQKLGHALLTDISWIREQTRLGVMAADWDRSARAAEFLLRGSALSAAELWVSQRPREAPEPTPLQIEFIHASREGEQARLEQEKARLAEVAGAQARTKRAQRRTFGVLTLMAASVVGGLWGVYAFWQNVTLNRAEFIASVADDLVKRANDPVTAMLLGLEALPDRTSTSLISRVMPREASAEHALDAAWRDWGVRPWHERRQLSEHESIINAVAFSPDGRLVLTSSFDKTARLWEAATGKGVATLSSHEDNIFAVAFSPDGRLVLTGSDDKTARLWEVSTGKTVATLSGHEAGISAAAFSPDGRLVLTGSEDNTARLWEAATGKAVATLSGHEAGIYAAAFSPDGRLVLTGSEDNTARLWEGASGKAVATFSGHEAGIYAAAFSPDGRLVLTGSRDKTARLWEVSSGKAVATLTGHRALIGAVAFSTDGRLVLTGSFDNTARLWEAATGKAVATLSGHEARIHAVAFSSDGRLALTGAADNTARQWPVLPGTQALVETAKSIVPRCLTPAQRAQFHLSPAAPRWCVERKLWPYDGSEKTLATVPPLAWTERLVAAWNWATAMLRPQAATARS